jgi:hypothetical protein
MKYKVLDIIGDGVILGNKHEIKCIRENSIFDYQENEAIDVDEIGMILSDKMLDGAEVYWSYSRKQWNNINKEFGRVNKGVKQ